MIRNVARAIARNKPCGLVLAALCSASCAQETPAPEPLGHESSEGAPPAGRQLLPDVTVGGYATFQFLSPDGPGAPQPASLPGQNVQFDDPQYARRPRFDLSHLSGIAWWEPNTAWKVLGEIDFQDVVQFPRHSDTEDGPDSAPYVSLDRLYADYRASDSLTLRAGKFLTPIGRWNQEHSDPQVWTVLRPLISQSAFPLEATGAMVLGSLPAGGQWIDYQAFVSGGSEWRSSPHTHRFERAVGARVSTGLADDLDVGVSVAHFVQDDYAPSEFNLLGIDGRWRAGRLMLGGEAIIRRATDGPEGLERGGFLQSVYALGDRWWLVGRVEAYRRAVDVTTNRTALVGLVYRTDRHWVFKAEWAQPSDNSAGLPSGLLAAATLVY